MFGRVLVVASTAGVVLSSPALRPLEQEQEVVAVARISQRSRFSQKKGMQAASFDSIDLSAVGKVTSGSYAEETHASATCVDTKPVVEGSVLNVCIPSSDGISSMKLPWCGWNADNSVLYLNELVWDASNTCGGTISSNETYSGTGLTNGCDSAEKTKYQCGTGVSWSSYGAPQHAETYAQKTCSGAAVEWEVDSYGACTAHGACNISTDNAQALWSEKAICDTIVAKDDGDDDFCFHVDSKINYKGIEYTYQELKDGKESECTVPHSPHSRGVIISTSCGKAVRVTDTHLLATTKGFRLAYSLKAGDVMYGGYDNSDMCTIQSVEKEKTTQQYFGLNCVHSEVLASGLRASTFGDFHTLPSWYMTYVGSLVGMDTASHLGEFIAEWFYQ